jgi:glycine/D-amino acid oxidase-like deaminating enzyme
LQGLSDFSEPHSIIDPRDVPNYNPEARHRALRAVYVPNEGWLNPKIVLQKLENLLFENSRVTYRDETVISIKEESGRVSYVLTASGIKVEGDQYVLANGFGISPLLVGTTFDEVVQPIFSSVGVSLEIKAPDDKHTHVVRTPNRGGGCGIYAVPYFKGPGQSRNHVLVGASSVTTIEPRFHGRIVSIAHLLHSAIKEINQNFYNAELIETNVGNRPTTLDQYPLIGRVENSNLIIISGTKRDGFHLAPLISEHILKLISDASYQDPYAMFSPSRKLIRALSRQKGVEALVVGKMNEAYQHGFTAASIFQQKQLEDDWRRTINQIHDEVNAETWGIPNQLLGVYREVLADKQKYENIYQKIIKG